MASGASLRPTALELAAREQRQEILESGLPLGNVVEPEEGGAETKARILDTAITLFGERGFEACTMRDLAGEVGIKAPAIYNHYDSKEVVLAAAMEHILGRFVWSVLSPLDGRPIESWLERIVKGHVDFQLTHRRLSRANMALLNAPGRERVLPAEVFDRIATVERAYVALLESLVRLAAAGTDRWDGLMSGFAISAACDRVVAWYDPAGKLTSRQVANRTWRLVERMIGADSGS